MRISPVQQIENVSSAGVLRLFHEPRDHDHKQLAARYRRLLQSLDRKTAAHGRQRRRPRCR